MIASELRKGWALAFSSEGSGSGHLIGRSWLEGSSGCSIGLNSNLALSLSLQVEVEDSSPVSMEADCVSLVSWPDFNKDFVKDPVFPMGDDDKRCDFGRLVGARNSPSRSSSGGGSSSRRRTGRRSQPSPSPRPSSAESKRRNPLPGGQVRARGSIKGGVARRAASSGQGIALDRWLEWELWQRRRWTRRLSCRSACRLLTFRVATSSMWMSASDSLPAERNGSEERGRSDCATGPLAGNLMSDEE